VNDLNQIFKLSKNALNNLSHRGKYYFYANILCLLFAAAIDGATLLLVGKLLGAIEVSSNSLNTQALNVLNFGILFMLFVSKGLGILFVNFLTLNAFGKEEGKLAYKLYAKYSAKDIDSRDNNTVGENLTTILYSPSSVIRGLLLKVPMATVELFNVVVILALLVFLNPLMAITSLLYFSVFVFFQHVFVSKNARANGIKRGETLDSISNLIIESNRMRKILKIMGSSSLDAVVSDRLNTLGKTQSRAEFYSLMPRLLLETFFGFGLMLIGVVLWAFNGIESALVGIALFGVAGFRLLPLLSHIQAITIQILGDIPIARRALLSENYEILGPAEENPKNSLFQILPGSMHLKIDAVHYSYPANKSKTLADVSMNLEFGKSYAIVGPTGAGKSTLVDLMLGLLQPTQGELIWNQDKPRILGYVPQNIELAALSISKNIALDWSSGAAVLSTDTLKKYTTLLNNLEENQHNESAIDLSGGQRQIVGILRALNHEPTFLVLDEASSALDNETESVISALIHDLKGKCTVILIAHRLNSIKSVDKIFFLDNGRVVSSGSFEKMRKEVPDFERQIRLGEI
jgi:ABC-type multidrug transport system fused ATPase/permease subunit